MRRYRSPIRPEFVAVVESLVDQGLPYALVGARLGVSKNAIVGIVHRYLPYSIRRQPLVSAPRSASATRGNSPRREPSSKRVVARPAPSVVPIAAAPEPMVVPPTAAEVVTRPIAVVLAGPGACRHPLWSADDGIEAMRFCGAHSGRATYCASHAALVYAPPKKRSA